MMDSAVFTWGLGRAMVAAMGIWVLHYLLQALYNVSLLHPLNAIPGPLLARASYLPEFYHDAILGGRYTHAIKRMHDKYGKSRFRSPFNLGCCVLTFDTIFKVLWFASVQTRSTAPTRGSWTRSTPRADASGTSRSIKLGLPRCKQLPLAISRLICEVRLFIPVPCS